MLLLDVSERERYDSPYIISYSMPIMSISIP